MTKQRKMLPKNKPSLHGILSPLIHKNSFETMKRFIHHLKYNIVWFPKHCMVHIVWFTLYGSNSVVPPLRYHLYAGAMKRSAC